MRLRPMPVVMVSTLTQRGAEITLAALEQGAVDYFAKPTENVAALFQGGAAELIEKVKAAAHARVRPRATPAVSPGPTAETPFNPGDKIVAIGSSTGGVEALIKVLSHFPTNCPPTVITQHMPAHFTSTFADRLSRLCRPNVTEARDGDVLIPGHVVCRARRSRAFGSRREWKPLRCKLTAAELVNGHRPSVDVLFKSIAGTARNRGIGVLLTGMGRDGAAGLLAMRAVGAATIGQDGGIQRRLWNAARSVRNRSRSKQLPLENIGPEILRLCPARSEGVLKSCPQQLK